MDNFAARTFEDSAFFQWRVVDEISLLKIVTVVQDVSVSNIRLLLERAGCCRSEVEASSEERTFCIEKVLGHACIYLDLCETSKGFQELDNYMSTRL